MTGLAGDYERRLATALEECIEVYNRAISEDRNIYVEEVAGIGDIIRGKLARVPWVDVDVTGVQGPPYKVSEDAGLWPSCYVNEDAASDPYQP